MDAIGRLASGVAHDFNNLLGAILVSADLLLEELAEDHPGREDATEIRKATMRASTLTRQLLAFGRKQALAPQVLNLNDLVAGLEEMLRRLLGESIEMRTGLSPGLGTVRADPVQLEQVIVNLVVNARDAMPHGGRLTVETANVELDEAYARTHAALEPGLYVMLTVTDTGSGMDAATQARLFEPFFTTKSSDKGTGLGLATVYGILKQSGGYIWVYSEPGKGTVFKIYLPLLRLAAVALVVGGEPRATLRGTETVLVVEDQEQVRRVTRKVLEARGYRVLVATNGPQALELSEEYKGTIDILVTDVMMPGMSGRDVAVRLAKRRPKMRVLFVSGYADESIVHHGVLEPGVALLQKPFTADELARKVRDVLEG
jgi:CheY-like chemotaxis protein